MVVCSPASLSRSSGILFSHTLNSQEFEVSKQIKVHVSGLWEETGAKAHTGPGGEKNIRKCHIESKLMPKPSRQVETGLITAGIKTEIQTTRCPVEIHISC